ncbi:hypothetical protein CLOM621_08497 [Clostridium sp. M62/1]|nr:hypothetical protein CLOM621_08497 [Clostridium sp. M62/1]
MKGKSAQNEEGRAARLARRIKKSTEMERGIRFCGAGMGERIWKNQKDVR